MKTTPANYDFKNRRLTHNYDAPQVINTSRQTNIIETKICDSCTYWLHNVHTTY